MTNFKLIDFMLLVFMLFLFSCSSNTTDDPGNVNMPEWVTVFSDNFDRANATGASCNWDQSGYKTDGAGQTLPNIENNQATGNNMNSLTYDSPLNGKAVKLTGKFKAAAISTSAGFIMTTADSKAMYWCMLSYQQSTSPTHKFIIQKISNLDTQSPTFETLGQNTYDFDLTADTVYNLEVTFDSSLITGTLRDASGTLIRTITASDTSITPYYFGFILGNQSTYFYLDDFKIEVYE